MRVVFDTNLLVLSLVGDPATAIMRAALADRVPEPLVFFYTPATLHEYRGVLARLAQQRPEVFVPEHLAALLQQVEARGHLVHPTRTLEVCPHAPDNRFLECAVESRAEYLITVNTRHFPLAFSGIKVISPRLFYTLLFG